MVPHGFAFPDFSDLAAVELQQGRAVIVAGGDEYLVATHDRVGGVDVVARHPRVFPKFPAILKGDGIDRPRAEDRQTGRVVNLKGHGRRVTRAMLARRPEYLAAPLVERRTRGAN